jgi:type IV fimbrial biogenesis protein FimT
MPVGESSTAPREPQPTTMKLRCEAAPAGGFTDSQGLTLLELLVTLAAACMLLSVAVPHFVDVTRNNRAAANANVLLTALSIARSEAIKRGTRVSLCASTNGASCGETWSDGWIVFVDGAASDTALPSVTAVLHEWPAPLGAARVMAEPDVTWIRFLPRGNAITAGTMPLTYSLEIEGCAGLEARSIEIDAVGRTFVARAGCS